MSTLTIPINDITEKTLNQDILNKDEYEQEQWLLSTGQLLSNWETIEDYSIMRQAEILYKVWVIWDKENNPNGDSLIATATYRWSHDFDKWAKKFTKFRASKMPSSNTIANKIGVYKDYIGEGTIEYPEYIKIPKRDEFGQLVDSTLESEEAWETIEFDPRHADYGKLLVARGQAKKGVLSEISWSGIMDPNVSVRELKKRIKKDVSGNGSDDNEDFHIEEDEGIIYGVEGEHRVAVMAALWENSDDPLFSKTLHHIFASAGLKMKIEYK